MMPSRDCDGLLGEVIRLKGNVDAQNLGRDCRKGPYCGLRC
jgi:hypothetical protein